MTVRALVPLLLLSGASSLVYETIWARQLHLVLGTSQLAISVVLAAFMAGLALGAVAAGCWVSRIARPLLAYGLLEGFIGIYALAFPFILERATPLFLSVGSGHEDPTVLVVAWQFLLATLLLLPPTICMGATLPLLARIPPAHTTAPGLTVGRLYGANTIGAVLGAALAGFVLIPLFGLTVTNLVACTANELVALTALGLAVFARHAALPPAPKRIPGKATKRNATAKRSSSLAGLYWAAAIAGFCALLYELVWFRLMTLILGGTVYAFSIMLVAFLAGIGLGGWIGGGCSDYLFRRGKGAAVLRGIAWLQVGVALFSWACMHIYTELPLVFIQLHSFLDQARHWFLPSQLLLAMVVMFPPALLMGATFPFLVRATGSDPKRLNRDVGFLYAANTLGAVAAAFLGGVVILPGLQMKGALLLAVSLNFMVAGLAYRRRVRSADHYPRARWAGWTALGVSVAVGMYMLAPSWNQLLMTLGPYANLADFKEYTRQDLSAHAATFELKFYREGRSSVVTVGRNLDSGQIWMANNGKTDASTSQRDMQTQVLLGHLPFAFERPTRDVLIVGMGSGVTAGAVTLHSQPQRIEIVEIESAVVAASHYFDHCNHQPLKDPRVSIHLNDARNHLLRAADRSYDLVISEPSNPWISGVSSLFTREFFDIGKRKLRTGGVWTQWLHLYGMAPDDLRCLLATFASTFEHVLIFGTDGADILLVGSDQPLSLRLPVIDALFRIDPIAAELKSVNIPEASDILAMYLMDTRILRRIAGDAGLNTDDNLRIEYSAPLHLHDDTYAANFQLLRRSFVVMPSFAVSDWLRMAEAYARHGDEVRARLAIEAAGPERPDNAVEPLAQRSAVLKSFEEHLVRQGHTLDTAKPPDSIVKE